MLIHSLRLENAKSYKEAFVEFTPGVNAIVGHNGAGKSTIVEAIGLALFDEISYTRSEFVRQGARTATISVVFESTVDERPYEVVRRIGGSSAYHVDDPETGLRICEGKADVATFVKQHLGIDSSAKLDSLFRDAIGVPQGTFTAAFLLTEAPRKSVFDPMLQVQDYRSAYQKLRSPLSYLKEQHQALEVAIAEKRGQLVVLPELERDLNRRSKELEQAAAELAALRKTLASLEEKRSALEEVRERLQQLRTEHGQAKLRLEANTRELAAARQAYVDAENAAKLVEENKAGYEAYVAAQLVQKGLDEKLRKRTELESKRNQIDQAVAVAQTTQQQIAQELASIEEAATTMSALQQPVERQMELEQALDQARQDMVKYRAITEQVRNEEEAVTRLAADITKLSDARATAGQFESEAASLQQRSEPDAQQLDDLRNKNAEIKTRAKSLKEQMTTLGDISTAVCPVCEQPLTEQHRVEMIRRNEQQVEELREEYREIQQQIKDTQQQALERSERLRAIEAQLMALPRQNEVERNEVELQRTKQRLRGLSQQRDQLAGVEARIQRLQSEIEQLGNPKREYEIAKNRASQREAVARNQTATEQKLAELAVQHAEVDAALEQYVALDREMEECEAVIAQSEPAYRTVLGNQRVAQSVNERKADVAAAEVQKQSLEELSEQLEKQIADTEQRFDEEQYQQAQSEEQAQRQEIGALTARIQVIEQQQQENSAAITRLQQLQQEMAADEEQLRQITRQTSTLSKIRDVVREAGPYVTRVLINQVSGLARRYFSDIMSDYSRHLSWNEDYSITLSVGQHTREFAQLSGGEQMSAALAVRLAMLRELTSIDIAFFDEPTANLDDERRDALAQQILQVEGFRQLFVISHDDTFEQATQNIIRVERLNGESVVTTG